MPLLCSIYFWQVSTNWVYFFMLGYFGELYSLIASFILPESPRFSLEMKRFDELKATLEQIASWNRKEFDWDHAGLKEEEGKNGEHQVETY